VADARGFGRRLVVAIAAAAVCPAAGAQPPRTIDDRATASRTIHDGVYTTAQAARGRAIYDEKCASCHGSMASIVPSMAPLLNDYDFRDRWRDRTLDELFERIRDTMPQNEPNTLGPSELADLIAYILRANDLPTGEIALPGELELLKQIRVTDAPP
jgi:mono/diheme cytochrome c family protein